MSRANSGGDSWSMQSHLMHTCPCWLHLFYVDSVASELYSSAFRLPPLQALAVPVTSGTTGAEGPSGGIEGGGVWPPRTRFLEVIFSPGPRGLFFSLFCTCFWALFTSSSSTCTTYPCAQKGHPCFMGVDMELRSTHQLEHFCKHIRATVRQGWHGQARCVEKHEVTKE